jgi:hypothetical protein
MDGSTAVAILFFVAVVGGIGVAEANWLKRKGYSPAWAILTVFLGLIGFLVIAALKDKREQERFAQWLSQTQGVEQHSQAPPRHTPDASEAFVDNHLEDVAQDPLDTGGSSSGAPRIGFPATPHAAPTEFNPPPVRRNTRPWLILAMVILGLLLVGALIVRSQRGPSSSDLTAAEPPPSQSPSPDATRTPSAYQDCRRAVPQLRQLAARFQAVWIQTAEVFNQYEFVGDGVDRKQDAINRLFNRVNLMRTRLRSLRVAESLRVAVAFLGDGFEDAMRGAQMMTRALDEVSVSAYNQARLLLNGSHRLVERGRSAAIISRCG